MKDGQRYFHLSIIHIPKIKRYSYWLTDWHDQSQHNQTHNARKCLCKNTRSALLFNVSVTFISPINVWFLVLNNNWQVFLYLSNRLKGILKNRKRDSGNKKLSFPLKLLAFFEMLGFAVVRSNNNTSPKMNMDDGFIHSIGRHLQSVILFHRNCWLGLHVSTAGDRIGLQRLLY